MMTPGLCEWATKSASAWKRTFIRHTHDPAHALVPSIPFDSHAGRSSLPLRAGTFCPAALRGAAVVEMGTLGGRGPTHSKAVHNQSNPCTPDAENILSPESSPHPHGNPLTSRGSIFVFWTVV
jgi:hypothetical protein